MPDIAVIGAGPFGLSVAAHLGARARVFGAPMQTWRTRMPPDMLMRSAWEETSLSAPGGGTIDDWAAATGERKVEPLPLQTFLRYADWFRERHVADHDPHDVAAVEPDGDRLRVTTIAGDAVDVRAVVVAVGVTPFPHAPNVFAEHLGGGVGFAIEEQDVAALAGRRVLVVGAGQAGLETAGIAAREGAAVELVTRSDVRWFADREPQNYRGALRRRLYRLAYPAVGYGPPPLNRLVLHPDLFAALPASLRQRLTSRLLRPGGSPWVRDLVEGRVRLTRDVVPVRVEANGGIRVELSDGSSREIDRVLLATGYRFDADRLAFLEPALRGAIRTENGWPVLDRHFRSSDPRLLFAGYAAEGRFGPISRFVLGCDFTASRIAAALA